METRQLEIFLAAARSRSFGKAAKELYLSRSTVSRAVQSLEKELGMSLVERSSSCAKELCLTPAGRALAEGAAELLKAADELAERARAAQ